MARYAIIEGGIVANVVEAEADFASAQGWIPAQNAGPGWLYDGQAFSEPPPPQPVVPDSVTMRQARLALLGAGKLAAVDAAIASLPSPMKEAAQIEWEYAATVERSSPLIAQLAPALSMSDAEMDALFVEAAKL